MKKNYHNPLNPPVCSCHHEIRHFSCVNGHCSLKTTQAEIWILSKMCHGFLASWREAVLLSLWSLAFYTQTAYWLFQNLYSNIIISFIINLELHISPFTFSLVISAMVLWSKLYTSICLYTGENANIQASLKA